MRITIKDIAKTAELSITTVSMVLNGKENRIAEETKNRVLRVARELHYRPNRLAASLVTKRSKTIGLIVPDISNLFFAQLAKGCEHECDKLGYNIILCNTNDNPKKDIAYIDVLMERSIDGLIYAMSSQMPAQEIESAMEEFKKPIVFVDRFNVGDDNSSVAIDHRLGGYTATKYLIDHGHRKIACISGPLDIYTAALRFEGYKAALKENGIEYNSEYVREGDYHIESGEILATQLLLKDITAIFSCNDMMAYGVYKAAAKLHKVIPEDVSLVGFDNVFFLEILEVPLTTINQPIYDIGKAAIKKAIALIENSAENEQIIFSPSLVERMSVKTLKED